MSYDVAAEHEARAKAHQIAMAAPPKPSEPKGQQRGKKVRSSRSSNSSSSSSSGGGTPSASSSSSSSSTSSSSPSSSTGIRTSAIGSKYLSKIREYALLMEYKKLKTQAPPGIYVLPSVVNLRVWHGVIFTRQGRYRGGCFRFRVDIPQTYPENGPTVHFVGTKIFHPLINPHNGKLDLSIHFEKWISTQHYIVLVLAYVKKIFYDTKMWGKRAKHVAYNIEAQEMWLKDPEQFTSRCQVAAKQSMQDIYENTDPTCSIRFVKPTMTAGGTGQQRAHAEVLHRIIHREKETEDPDFGYDRWFADGVYRIKS